MSQDEMFDRLRIDVNKLHGLLADPQPGISSWCVMTGEAWKRVAELWNPELTASTRKGID